MCKTGPLLASPNPDILFRVGTNVQIGQQNTPLVDFLGGKVGVETSVEGEGSSGFEAILGALVGGDKSDLRAAVSMKAELGPMTGTAKIELDTAKVKAALEKLKDALSPIAAAFDALLVPDPQQISKAQDAFAELAAAVNNHSQRYDAASTLPMGMFADQFGALRQAETAKGPGNLMQLGNMLSRLDTLLGDFKAQGQASSAAAQPGTEIKPANINGGGLTPDGGELPMTGEQAVASKSNAKLSLNIHQMIGRLDALSEKLPETAQAAIAKLVDSKVDQLPTGATPITSEGKAAPDPLAKLLSGEGGETKKNLQNGSSSNLISAALEAKSKTPNQNSARRKRPMQLKTN